MNSKIRFSRNKINSIFLFRVNKTLTDNLFMLLIKFI